MKHEERSVVILERVFRDAKVELETILRSHGINPQRPYTHEDIVVDGAPAHRYIQPPRPVRPASVA